VVGLSRVEAGERIYPRRDSARPDVRRLEAAHGELDPAFILEVGLFDAARKSLDVRRWLREEALRSLRGDLVGPSDSR